MGWTLSDYLAHEERIARGRKGNRNANHTEIKIPDTQPERKPGTSLEQTSSGEKGGAVRTVVRFVGYRVRPLDPDNFAGSVKDLLDGLRHSGLIHGDEPWRIKLETEQVKVGHFCEEKTEIIIDAPLLK